MRVHVKSASKTGWRTFSRSRQGDGNVPKAKKVVLARSTASEPGDVYLKQPDLLSEDVTNRTISVFVADESGMIDRVAAVFARRGFNIESLAVGLNIDKALFTIEFAGEEKQTTQVVQQLRKLVKVREVEDITDYKRVEREMLMVKVNAPVGAERTAMLEIAEMFRAQVVDVAPRNLIFVASGDPGKTYAFQQALASFGIQEIARTGKIALQRQRAMENVGGWGDNASHISERKENMMQRQRMLKLMKNKKESEVGVYTTHDAEDDEFFYTVLNTTEVGGIETRRPGLDSGMHMLSILVDNEPGVLIKVTAVFARRGYNVQSLAVGPAVLDGSKSRITMVVPGTNDRIDNLMKQLEKLVCVVSVTNLSNEAFVDRELMLVKVFCESATRGELLDLLSIFRAKVCDISQDTMTIEVTGNQEKISALQDLLKPYGILEVARTGLLGLTRGLGVDTKRLEISRHRQRLL